MQEIIMPLFKREMYEWSHDFCQENWYCSLCDREKNEDIILWSGEYWFVVHNKYPYNGLKNHIMAVPLLHKTKTTELSWNEWQELSEVEKFIEEYYKWENYFCFVRNTMWWRSLQHLHYQYMPWILKWEALRAMLAQQWYKENI